VVEGGACKLFVEGGSTSATSVLLRRRYPLTVRGNLFTLNVGGLAVAGPYHACFPRLFIATLEN